MSDAKNNELIDDVIEEIESTETEEDILDENDGDVIEGEAQLVPYDKQHITTSTFLSKTQAESFADYLYEYKTSKGQVVIDIDAHGVRHLASDTGVGIESCTYKEHDDYFEAEAVAKSLDGRRYFATRRQNKKITTRDGKSFDDKDALPKCITAAQRNALRGLVPTKMVCRLIQKSSKINQENNALIAQIQEQCRELLRSKSDDFSELGITSSMIYQEAKFRNYGKEWSMKDWMDFRTDIVSWKTNWINDLRHLVIDEKSDE